MLFKILLPRHTLHSILSIQDVVCSTVGIEDGWRGRQLPEATSGFLATRAIAAGGQNRPADCLQFHLAASAYPGEVFLLFLVHCNRPFVGPVYEVILALVRNIRNRSKLGSPGAQPGRSALLPRTDMVSQTCQVRKVPNLDVAAHHVYCAGLMGSIQILLTIYDHDRSTLFNTRVKHLKVDLHATSRSDLKTVVGFFDS